MITVVGGTGLLGSALIPLLHERGATVRVASRRASLAPELRQMVTDVVAADVREPATLGAAVTGSDVVVSAVHGVAPGDRHSSPATVDVAGNAHLVDAAASAGADVVLLSIVGAAPDGGELQRAKWAAEQYLRGSGVPWTIVRATAYLEQWEQMLRGSGERPTVFGRGANPVNLVPVAAVARVVADACVDPGDRGHVLEVRGERDLTLTELAASVCPPGVRPRHVPRPVLHAMGQLARPVRPDLARLARMGAWMDTADLRGAADAGVRVVT